jgi:hypothetical protein
MKKVVLILFVICFSCTEQKSIHVDIYGISFNCPSGWKITEKEDYGAAKYICIEKKGITSSGLVTMSFIEGDIELYEYLQFMQESFLGQEVFKDLVFQQAKESYYGKYKGIVSSYTAKIMFIKHKGEIYIFHENGITMALIKQEAIEDHEENLQGFETIKKSLSLTDNR